MTQPTALTLAGRQDISDSDLISIAQLAERLGYHTLWTGESWGRDAFTVLTMIACHTESIRLGTGIVPVFSRTPALIAQSIASLDQISHGRATLGLGTSGRLLIEEWHGLPYHRPIARTREYIEIIRQALSGQALTYEGQFFRLGRFRLGASPVQANIPIFLASLGPKNLELTGQLADGWLPIWVHQNHLPSLKEQVSKAAQEAGRDISQVTVAPQIMCYVSETAKEQAEVDQRIRAHMAYYIAGMGQYYYDLFCRSGFQEEADAVRVAWANRDRDKAASLVSEDMLSGIAVSGDAATCRASMDRFRRNGADMPIVAFPHGSTLDGIKRTLEVLAPAKVAQPGSAAGFAN
ncbi:MAG: LLM class flavin-dependent oxidoreductase [Chloroflexi bacterium]|nr:LLM class flavin-dependent oxidoreductase [Chloroflexota bacterium]